ALSIAQGKGYSFGDWARKTVYPGLPYALAGVEKVFGPAKPTPGIAEQQRLVGPSPATGAWGLMIPATAALTPIVTYRLLRLHYATWVATTITCGVGTNSIFLQHAHELLTDVPFLLGVVTSLYGWDLLKRATTTRTRTGALAIAAVGIVLAATMRPT